MVRWYDDSKVLEMSRIKKEVFMKPVNIEIYTTMARAGTAGFRNTHIIQVGQTDTVLS